MKTILIADDNKLILLSLSELINLHDNSLEILTAENGRQAIDILESTLVDLVITDVEMPVMDGFELLAYICGNQPHIPTIVMTAAVDRVIHERLRTLGVTGFLLKPFDLKMLLERIDTLLGSGMHTHCEPMESSPCRMDVLTL